MPTPALRLLPLQGGINFRDLGGYLTHDGRRVAHGKVFRTGVLSYLTSDDHAKLGPLGVRAICDLRRADERSREPTVWGDSSARSVSWNDGAQPPTIRAIAGRHPNTAAGMHTAMCELYRELPVWLAPRLRDIVVAIADGELPVVIHCAAGKDRTGVVAALILAALDVPHESIVADYLATNDAGDFEQFILMRQSAQLGLAVDNHPLLALPLEIRRVIFAADAAYLSAAIEEIERQFGTVATYLSDCAKVDTQTLRRLHVELLQP